MKYFLMAYIVEFNSDRHQDKKKTPTLYEKEKKEEYLIEPVYLNLYERKKKLNGRLNTMNSLTTILEEKQQTTVSLKILKLFQTIQSRINNMNLFVEKTTTTSKSLFEFERVSLLFVSTFT